MDLPEVWGRRGDKIDRFIPPIPLKKVDIKAFRIFLKAK
jgi:hypothetical protein